MPFSRLLVAVGRAPRTGDLGMERPGCEVDDRGFVVVDDLLRTTNPGIWAAGDLTGHPQFTHTAGVHGSLAASNAVLGVRRRVDLTAVPRVTYTDPEVAAVGVPTDRERGDPCDFSRHSVQVTIVSTYSPITPLLGLTGTWSMKGSSSAQLH